MNDDSATVVGCLALIIAAAFGYTLALLVPALLDLWA